MGKVKVTFTTLDCVNLARYVFAWNHQLFTKLRDLGYDESTVITIWYKV